MPGPAISLFLNQDISSSPNRVAIKQQFIYLSHVLGLACIYMAKLPIIAKTIDLDHF